MNQDGISLSRQNVEKLSLILIPLEFGKVPTRKKLTSVDVKGGHGRGKMNSLSIHSKLKARSRKDVQLHWQ